jgi:hypothetical protein
VEEGVGGGWPLQRPVMQADLTIRGEDRVRGWSCEPCGLVERERGGVEQEDMWDFLSYFRLFLNNIL